MGFGFGLFWFFKGFRDYREFRVVEDTPEMPIRSVPMGLVHVHGKATGEQRVTGPITGTPCFFYKVDIERWVRDKSGGHWSHAATRAEGVRFCLADATGKVLVDAHGAEYDLILTTKRETGSGAGASLGRLFGGTRDSSLTTDSGVSDSDLLNYAESVVSTAHTTFPLDEGVASQPGHGLPKSGDGFEHRYRLSEYCIVPLNIGTTSPGLALRTRLQDEHDRNMIVKGQNEPIAYLPVSVPARNGR